MKYAIDFDEVSIMPLNSDFKIDTYEHYQQADSFAEAKELSEKYPEIKEILHKIVVG